MLYDLLKEHLGQNAAPFVAIALFVIVVGVSLWLTPRLSNWIDDRRKKTRGFFDDMMEHPPEDERDDKDLGEENV